MDDVLNKKVRGHAATGSVIFLSLLRRGQRVPLRSSDLSMSCCSMEAALAAAEATLSHRSAFWSTRCLACSSMRIPKRCLRRGRLLPRWPLSTCCLRVRPVTVARSDCYENANAGFSAALAALTNFEEGCPLKGGKRGLASALYTMHDHSRSQSLLKARRGGVCPLVVVVWLARHIGVLCAVRGRPTAPRCDCGPSSAAGGNASCMEGHTS